MVKYQVIAVLSTNQSFVGEIVAFNCTGVVKEGLLIETAREQAERFQEVFQRSGNGMIDKVVAATGATMVEYRIRIQ